MRKPSLAVYRLDFKLNAAAILITAQRQEPSASAGSEWRAILHETFYSGGSVHWDYYDPNFDWDDRGEHMLPDLTFTRQRFAELGMSSSDVEAFIRSGYVMFEPELGGDMVIDRFYGGAVRSVVFRTRFPAAHFIKLLADGRNAIMVSRATCVEEVFKQVAAWTAKQQRPLLFRGQTENYPLVRERPNPFLQVADMGEISLLPGVWRAMLHKNPMTFRHFEDLLPLEWEFIVREQFNLSDIQERVDNLNAQEGWIHSYQDMEDSDDPVLHEFGRTMLDVSMGARFNLALPFLTLLQHYGLYSPLLDLTSDMEVALFFATHKLTRIGVHSRYEFVGTNRRHALLYVFRQDPKEMAEYAHERALHLLKPLRPLRQSCVVCTSAPLALNLPADFLVGIIQLDFDLSNPSRLDTSTLFPSDREDNFLATLKKAVHASARVTDFSP